ncbi:MAG: TonB-dependent receptor, partial [Dysgonamonadaceae bacterium]|nr:TonB-dependent receptor [Dysgonamonadaceae bacterium]
SNLTGTFENNGRLAFKMYYYGSERGLPGAAIYYMDYSGERLKDRNAFAQVRYEQPLNEKIDFMAHAKVNFSTIDYTDVQNFYPGGEKESHYEQREYYLNTTVLYQLSRHLSFSWANDGIAGNFRSNLPNNVFPSRIAWLSALSGQYEAAIFTLTAKLLYTAIDDRAKIGNAPADYSHFSPYLSFSVHPLKNIPLRLRGFYKNSFRMPTFGDLYYSIRPTLNLKPENAHQYNAGLTFAASGNRLFSLISFSGDLYRYRIENKIVAIPKSSLFSQSIQNYGKVETTGVDMSLKIHLQTGKRLLWKINGTYTYQKVLDKTDPNTGIYNQQIPYTPCHTASGYIRLETPWINFNYTLLYSGKRYYERVNRREFQMNAFTEQGIALTKNMRRKNVSYILKAECANLFNVPYEVVRSYPMPGRSFRFGINLNY